MTKITQGMMDASGKRFGLISSRYNEFITSKLISGAVDELVRHGAREEQIEVVWVPGAFEIPAVARKLAKKKKHDALICLGCVMRGDTPHFDFIAAEVSKGVASVGLECDIPVVFGVLTTDTLEQAIERAGAKGGNKGSEAAMAAIELVSLFKQIGWPLRPAQ
jgi:6,7-dimethyl-8-ribityllumazine synthase